MRTTTVQTVIILKSRFQDWHVIAEISETSESGASKERNNSRSAAPPSPRKLINRRTKARSC